MTWFLGEKDYLHFKQNPKNRNMAKQKFYIPKPGKCDIIESILIGNQEINALNKKNPDHHKPDFMIKKLSAVAVQSSCKELKQQAEAAVELLKVLPGALPANEFDRYKILKSVSTPSNVAMTK